MNELNFDATIVFQQNYDAMQTDKRFILNQGSSRSSKTISLCQLMIVYALTHPNKTISIVRKTFPTLRATVLRDFMEILNQLELYDRNAHNKTENTYTFTNGTMVEFFSTDQEVKLRGRKRDMCWVNEANELFYDDFVQLNLRTIEKLFFDYNPSDATSWLYDLDPEESVLIKSTYKHNPFLQDTIIKQIENLKKTDEHLWSIYGLGERSMSRKNIWSNWTFLDAKPDKFKNYVYGLDFGYNHPSSLCRTWYHEDEIYVESLIYESYLTTSDLIQRFKDLEIETNVEILCDYSRPEIIQELKEVGYFALNANKAVKEGINHVKTYTVFAQDNPHIRKEYENYMWQKKGDLILDVPVKLWDDFSDSLRYSVYHIKESNGDTLISLSFS